MSKRIEKLMLEWGMVGEALHPEDPRIAKTPEEWVAKGHTWVDKKRGLAQTHTGEPYYAPWLSHLHPASAKPINVSQPTAPAASPTYQRAAGQVQAGQKPAAPAPQQKKP